jgi:hypothetical protein
LPLLDDAGDADGDRRDPERDRDDRDDAFSFSPLDDAVVGAVGDEGCTGERERDERLVFFLLSVPLSLSLPLLLLELRLRFFLVDDEAVLDFGDEEEAEAAPLLARAGGLPLRLRLRLRDDDDAFFAALAFSALSRRC